MDSDLTAAAADFIRQYEWNWWCSLTFMGCPSEPLAHKLFRCWINKLNRKTFGSNYYRRGEGLRWIRGSELQKRESIHFHVFIAGDPKPTCEEAQALWESLGGNAKVEAYDPTLDAAGYTVKQYAAEGNIDLGGPWPCLPHKLNGIGVRPPQ